MKHEQGPAGPGAPHLADNVTREAYSHEVRSYGFLPGHGRGSPAFSAYAYPEPANYPDPTVRPAAAF